MHHTVSCRSTARAEALRRVLASIFALLVASGAMAQEKIFDPLRFKGTPLPQMNPDDLISITAGMHHACVIQRDGGVLCWGRGDSGQLGLPALDACGAIACSLQPTRVATDVNGARFAAVQISGGADHTCALTSRGAAYCWGSNMESQTGVPSLLQVWQPTPTAVGKVFSAIGAGSRSTCAVEPNSTWCWGLIGDGSRNGPTWQPMSVPSSAGYHAVSVGDFHACMQSNGSSYSEVNCVGNNQFGQLGFDLSWGDALPHPSGSDFGRPAGQPSTRESYTCAARYADGTVACAGDNSWGQLGNGTRIPSAMPVPVGGGAKLRDVSAGWTHACALDPQQQAWCWGDNYFGQLGNRSRLASWKPVLVGGGAVTFRALAAGYLFTCGIGTDNQVYCWGNNDAAQMGRGYSGSFDWEPRNPSTVRM